MQGSAFFLIPSSSRSKRWLINHELPCFNNPTPQCLSTNLAIPSTSKPTSSRTSELLKATSSHFRSSRRFWRAESHFLVAWVGPFLCVLHPTFHYFSPNTNLLLNFHQQGLRRWRFLFHANVLGSAICFALTNTSSIIRKKTLSHMPYAVAAFGLLSPCTSAPNNPSSPPRYSHCIFIFINPRWWSAYICSHGSCFAVELHIITVALVLALSGPQLKILATSKFDSSVSATLGCARLLDLRIWQLLVPEPRHWRWHCQLCVYFS